jgi:hypothetical protein
MSVDTSRAIASLQQLATTVESAVIAELVALGPDLEQELQATRVHGDVSGATRASYRVYPVHDGDDGSSSAASGVAAAEANNPGHGTSERHGSISGDVLLVASVFTDYAEIIATEEGGSKDAVSPFMARYGAMIAQNLAAAIRRRLG